jgi:hypothetical protein
MDVVPKLPISEDEKKYFVNFVLDNLNVYTDNYVRSYLNYFRQFQVRINTAWDLDYVLDDLQSPNSQLLATLVLVKTNTTLDLPNLPAFIGFKQKLAAFRFIGRLMEEKNGVYPEFQKYQAMMGQMQHDMDSREPYVPAKTDEGSAGLKGALTPMGRLAWAMRAGEEGSYINQVKMWLQNVAIQDEWQQPFIAPVQKLQDLGTAEVNKQVNEIWTTIWDANVAPQLAQFPFAANAGREQELSPDDLIKVFHPKQGVFWQNFNQYFTPKV